MEKRIKRPKILRFNSGTVIKIYWATGRGYWVAEWDSARHWPVWVKGNTKREAFSLMRKHAREIMATEVMERLKDAQETDSYGTSIYGV